MAPLTRVAFATTCRDRVDHLARTVVQNLVRAQDSWPACTHVLLDYGSTDSLSDFVRHSLGRWTRAGKLAYYRTEAPHYRSSHAKNMAHRLAIAAGADILVNLDADNQIGEDHPKLLVRALVPGVMSRVWDGHGEAGRLAVRREDFLRVRGYDESFVGWGFDDEDLYRRLASLGLRNVAVRPRGTSAIRHDDSLRIRSMDPAAGSTHDSSWANSHKALARPAGEIVNPLGFGMGTVYKDFGTEPIILGREDQ
jgi:hypothetical protein